MDKPETRPYYSHWQTASDEELKVTREIERLSLASQVALRAVDHSTHDMVAAASLHCRMRLRRARKEKIRLMFRQLLLATLNEVDKEGQLLTKHLGDDDDDGIEQALMAAQQAGPARLAEVVKLAEMARDDAEAAFAAYGREGTKEEQRAMRELQDLAVAALVDNEADATSCFSQLSPWCASWAFKIDEQGKRERLATDQAFSTAAAAATAALDEEDDTEDQSADGGKENIENQ